MSQARNLANFGVHTTTSTGAVTFLDGATDVDVAQHDGSNGLKLGGTLVSATATELNLIDGGTARGTTAVASGDGVIVNDAGTMRMTDVDTVDTYLAGTTKTLTNKTVTSPVINTSVSGSAILDEDAMGSDSATQLATQQSIKAYVDGVGSQTGADAQALGTGDSPSFANIVGMIAPFAMASPPTGWLVCDGSAVSRTVTYSALFAAISTTWGVGDGSSTFNVPDLEGAFLRGTGSHATSNMADGADFAGPSVGAFENDQLQKFKLGWSGNVGSFGDSGSGSNAFRLTGSVGAGSYYPPSYPTDLFSTAVGNGTPRTGDETRPFNAGVKYCIKY